LRVRAWNRPPVEVEELAHLDAAARQVLTRRVDVGDDELQTLSGTGLGCGDALPEGDRALRVRGRQLDYSEVVAGDDVGVRPPSEALVEALCPIDVGDGQRHDLELHVHSKSALHPARRFTAYVCAGHV
jgi:hypothetical protein